MWRWESSAAVEEGEDSVRIENYSSSDLPARLQTRPAFCHFCCQFLPSCPRRVVAFED